MRSVVLALLIAWALSPFLLQVLPLFADLDIQDWFSFGKLLLSGLRLAVWAALLLLLARVAAPFLAPLLPVSRQFAVTKSARRFQGYVTELTIPLLFFLAICIPLSVVLVWPEVKAEVDTVFEERLGEARTQGVSGLSWMERTKRLFVSDDQAPFSEGSDAYEALLDETRRDVRAGLIKEPSRYFADTWLWSIAGALVLYLLTLNRGVRYRLATQYEKLLRFFEQSRFGLGGSARFAGLVEEWPLAFERQKKALFLGRSLYKSSLRVGIEDDRHMLTIAGSRSGKGTSAIVPNLYTWKQSAVVVDPKAENALLTARYRKEVLGQDVYLVDPFGQMTTRTDAINPLDFLDPSSLTFGEDIQVIAEALVVRDPGAKDRHWDDGAEMILSGLIEHVVTSPAYPNPTLATIRDLLARGEDERDKVWAAMLIQPSPAGLAQDAAARVLRGLETNEIVGILSNIDKHTQWLRSPALQKTLARSTFDFARLKEKPTTIYVILPSKYLKTHSRFLRLLINLAIGQLSQTLAQSQEAKESENQVLMLMDEFLALGYMQEVAKAFALMAGYNLVMWPFVQDLASMKALYGDTVNAFITNSRAVQVFGVSDPETTEFISAQLGERRLNTALSAQRTSGVRLRTQSEVSKDISIKSGRQYVLRSGETPLLLEKAPYWKDSYFAKQRAYEGWDDSARP